MQRFERLKVGLVGCGHIAGVHVRAWSKSGVADVRGVYDVNEEAAKGFAQRWGIPDVYKKLEDLIHGVDVVDDCSPPKIHVSVGLKTLESAKHYLVEKPMVLSSGDLDHILHAREAAGTEICVIHNLKYSPGVQQARKWVNDGRIGSIVSLERQFLTDPVTDRMLRAENHWSHALPGGRWVETLPHELYLIHDFIGPLDVEHVQTLRIPGSPHPHTADEMMVALRGDDTIATLRYSARCRSNHRTLTIHGTNGSIRVELLSSSAVLYKPRIHKWARGAGLDGLNALTAIADMIPDRLRAVKRRIRNETPHSQLIGDYARFLSGTGRAPVSIDEIAYVVRTGELIGQLAAQSSDVVA